MNDGELLELAALAAGIDGEWSSSGLWHRHMVWNPLTNNGDAFELMVLLEIAVNPFAGKTVVSHDGPPLTGAYEKWECHDYDGLAATRRAITRAAAEIGKRMKETPR